MPDTTTVVVVHGLWMTGLESYLLRNQLQARTGWATVPFRYRSVVDPLDKIALDLKLFIDTLPPGPVHLVAHSLGGIVVHRLMHGPGLARAGRAVLLCSPIRGSAAARQLARLPGGRSAIGKSVRETLLQSSHRAWEADREVGVIAGIRPMGLGRFISRLDRPNDGTVAVSETELVNASDSIELPVSHSSALFSSLVAAQIACFLRAGRFDKQTAT